MTPARRAELIAGVEAALALEGGVLTGREHIEALLLWFASSPAPGYWEVHDYADGWIPFATEAAARGSEEARNGCSVRMVPFCG